MSCPYTLGADLADTLEPVGVNVAEGRMGDHVVARTNPTRGGALADLAAVAASHLARVPASFVLEQAAGAPTTAGTAQQALFEVAGLEAGQTVLIHAGAGGVGSFVIQLARDVGARVIATASGDGLAFVRRPGAHQVVDCRAGAFEEAVIDMDVVLDTMGGDTQVRSLGVLRRGSCLGSTVGLPDDALASVHRVTAGFVHHQGGAVRLARLLDRIGAGKLELLVDRTVSLGTLSDAFSVQASGRARGKIIPTT